MGIKTQWYDDKKQSVIHYYEQSWTIEDYFQALSERDELLRNKAEIS